jgi:hypothetical protein
MSALVQNFSDFIKVLLQAFNFSSTFPGLLLVFLVQQFILPMVPHDSPLRQNDFFAVFTSPLGTLTCAAFLGYLLDAMNLRIIRLFEGYWVPQWAPLGWFVNVHRNFVTGTKQQIESIDDLVNDLNQEAEENKKQFNELKRVVQEDRSKFDGLKEKIELHQAQYAKRMSLVHDLLVTQRDLSDQLKDKYPVDEDSILPTSFGNVIAAAEEYPYIVFGMDAVTLWPYLVPILTQKGYAQFLMREKSVMDFLINMSIVTAVFGATLGVAETAVSGWSFGLAIKVSAVIVASLAFFYFSVQGAASWGAVVRSAFVLFREDLRQSLGLRQAFSYFDERLLWENTSEFLGITDSEQEQSKLGATVFSRVQSTIIRAGKER